MGSARQVDLCTRPLEYLEFVRKPYWGSALYSVKMVSTPHHYLKAVSWGASIWKKARRMHVLSLGREEEPRRPGPAKRSTRDHILSMNSSNGAKIPVKKIIREHNLDISLQRLFTGYK